MDTDPHTEAGNDNTQRQKLSSDKNHLKQCTNIQKERLIITTKYHTDWLQTMKHPDQITVVFISHITNAAAILYVV